MEWRFRDWNMGILTIMAKRQQSLNDKHWVSWEAQNKVGRAKKYSLMKELKDVMLLHTFHGKYSLWSFANFHIVSLLSMMSSLKFKQISTGSIFLMKHRFVLDEMHLVHYFKCNFNYTLIVRIILFTFRSSPLEIKFSCGDNTIVGSCKSFDLNW